MRVLLVSPLIQKCNYIGDYFARWPQLGLAYIASSLEQNGHEVRILEKKLFSGSKYPDTEAEVERINRLMLKDIEDFQPRIIGLTATTPVIMDAFLTAKAIKASYPDIPIVIGGRHATSEPFYTLEQCPQIDIVCRGEGEVTISEFADGLPWEKIKGITFRKPGNGFVVNPDQPLINDLDSLPYPAWHLLDQDFYFQPNISVMRGDYMRTASIMTSRGCPYRCSFCQSPELLDIYGGKYIRYHSVNRVVGEIEYLIDRFKIEGLSFSDDMFSIKRERVLAIANAMISRGINKKIKFTVNLRADRVDEDMLCALKDAGCIHVVYGSESGSEDTLERMNKGITIRENIEAIRLTKRHGLTAEANIVIGSPGETEKDFLKTLDFLKASRPDRIFVSKFYPLPGTGFFKELLNQGAMTMPQDWEQINELYVENDDFTFANMSPRLFVKLRNRLAREVVVFTNTSYIVKSNFKSSLVLTARHILNMFFYLSFLYLPLSWQAFLKKIAMRINVNLRYLLRR